MGVREIANDRRGGGDGGDSGDGGAGCHATQAKRRQVVASEDNTLSVVDSFQEIEEIGAFTQSLPAGILDKDKLKKILSKRLLHVADRPETDTTFKTTKKGNVFATLNAPVVSYYEGFGINGPD